MTLEEQVETVDDRFDEVYSSLENGDLDGAQTALDNLGDQIDAVINSVEAGEADLTTFESLFYDATDRWYENLGEVDEKLDDYNSTARSIRGMAAAYQRKLGDYTERSEAARRIHDELQDWAEYEAGLRGDEGGNGE